MKIRVLGCSTVELPNLNLPGFLVDEKILLDAGTIGAVLDESEQLKIKHVLVTHAHIDHIKDLPFFADNISMNNKGHHVTVISIPAVNKALKQNLLNNILWPDFTKIPTPDNPIIRLKNIRPEKTFIIDGYNVTAHKVNHTVPAVGYVIEDKKGKRLLYIGDTGPSDTIWTTLNKKIHCLIIEVSFPNRFKTMALATGHLTPKLLLSELKKIRYLPDKIFITHCKPTYRDRIRKELEMFNIKHMKILKDGARIEF
jgi:ribonuclease BN (tRNA processing enzyme)